GIDEPRDPGRDCPDDGVPNPKGGNDGEPEEGPGIAGLICAEGARDEAPGIAGLICAEGGRSDGPGSAGLICAEGARDDAPGMAGLICTGGPRDEGPGIANSAVSVSVAANALEGDREDGPGAAARDAPAARASPLIPVKSESPGADG